jgi:hypothetical protein
MTIGAVLDVAASVSGWPPSALGQLPSADTLKIVEALGNFLQPEPTRPRKAR